MLSIYSTRFSEKGISFDSQIQVSESLPCPELTCCAILSNILENAMHAVEKLPEERRQISLNIFEKSGHLLMLGKNPTDVPPVFSDDVPVTKKSDHGIGVQSIIYYVEKEQGQYQFYMEGRDFVVRIIL
ncbi:ATP-binding protein [Laedolimicola intestinihominis]|uniref:ATP-binding protein n=1 Tax=Laedolimicola intestinihominis TaxID=3133166 RepID=A0ABV1FKF0_9FIRM